MTDGFFEGLDFLTDPSLANDPYPYYDWLRQCPVLREPNRGVVMVSGYDEAWPDLTGGYKYLGLERMSYYVNKDAYRRAVRGATQSLKSDPDAAAPRRGTKKPVAS